MKILLLLLVLFLYSCTSISGDTVITQSHIDTYIEKISPLLKSKDNKEVVFYVDLTRHSGSNRFFVIDLKTQRLLNAGLTCNGVTDKYGKVIYSNRPGSHASSKGLYKVGYSYTGKFGKSYKLHGLNATNSNAFRIAIVLHKYKWMPTTEVPTRIFESEGCPTVSPRFFKELSKIIKDSNKPVLLYIQ